MSMTRQLTVTKSIKEKNESVVKKLFFASDKMIFILMQRDSHYIVIRGEVEWTSL